VTPKSVPGPIVAASAHAGDTGNAGHPFRVVIAGAGIAGLECALAVADLAGALAEVNVIAPDDQFVDQDLAIAEPFGFPTARRYSLEEILRDTGATHVRGELLWVDRHRQIAHASDGRTLEYDALLLAIGARRVPRYQHALTIDHGRLAERFHGLIQDVEEGYTTRVAFVSPGRMESPFPLYELALMTAGRAFDMGVAPTITLITPENAPLAALGTPVSAAVSMLLRQAQIQTITAGCTEIPVNGRIVVQPGDRRLDVDHAVALPELYGAPVRGIPLSANGFVEVDGQLRIPEAGPVYAAGDLTHVPLKHSAGAARQADAAAESIAALAGAAVDPRPLEGTIHGALLTDDRPLRFSADVSRGAVSTSRIVRGRLPANPYRVAAKYLAPALERLDREQSDRRAPALDWPTRSVGRFPLIASIGNPDARRRTETR
jgi:sulfide:quinone oxidoreductase